MASKLGSVWMEFRLDTKEAQKDLDKLEVKDRADVGKKPKIPTALIDHQEIPGVGKSRSETQKDEYLKQVAGAVFRNVRGGLQGNPAAAQITGLAGQAAPFMPPALARPLVTAGGVALAYGVASQTLKFLPEALAFGHELGGGKPADAASTQFGQLLDHIRNRVVALEAKVLSMFDAMAETIKYTSAVRRLTGEMPNTLFYYQQNQITQQQQRELDAKFDNFKTREAPFNTSRTMVDIFRRGISR